MIVMVRIDARLIHGQVANIWTPYLGITRIIVIDDRLSSSEIDKAGLRLACPASVKLSVLPIAKAAENILAGRYERQRVLIVVNDPKTLLTLLESGVPLGEINLGNMPKRDDTQMITKTVHVTKQEIYTLKKLVEKGIDLTAQLVPNEEKVKLIELL